MNRVTKPPGDPTPLKPNDLVLWFEEACNEGHQLIGTEHEKFGLVRDAETGTLEPLDYARHVQPMLADLQTEFGWAVGADRGTGGEVVALTRNNASVTLEPGGQLELSGAPFGSVHETCEEFATHRAELDRVAATHGVTLIAAGVHPFATRDEINWMPKGRYAVMREYLPTRGALALDMMTRTATVQANFDYRNEADCGRRLRLAASLTPALVAMFANSPFREGRFDGTRSRRSAVWESVDPDRCGMVEVLFDEAFSFHKYALWALEIPMFFVRRDGRYLPYHAPFSEFIERGFELDDGTVTWPTEADWRLHLNTLFPEARLNPFIEVRTPDSVAHEMICALPAFTKGLLYDDDALEEALNLLAGSSLDARIAHWREARTVGLSSDTIHAQCAALLDIATRGLDRIATRDALEVPETGFLAPLREIVTRRASPADVAIEALGASPGRSREGRDALAAHYFYAGAPAVR